MFPRHWIWHGMATMSPRWRTYDGFVEDLEERVQGAPSWDDLPLDDLVFLTACIRDVERGVNGDPPMGPVEELDGFLASLDTIGVPDTFGPFWGCPPSPDTPWAWRAPQYRKIQAKAGERRLIAKVLRDHQEERSGYRSDGSLICTCGAMYAAGALTDHQSEQIVIEMLIAAGDAS